MRNLAFALALVAALLWGLLPLALRVLVPALDPWTITWCRFLFAALCVGLFLGRRRQLPNPWPLTARLRLLLVVSVVGITLNYTLFVVGVRLTSPATAQVVAQLANVFLLFGGLLVFHERFSALQWLGVAVLIAGLALFFNVRLRWLFDGRTPLGWGVLLLTLGALSWAAYVLAQKRLLREWRSPQMLWLLYVGGTLLLTPLVHPRALAHLTAGQDCALLFCSCNTVIAYGAYGEAMKIGEVGRISATVTLSPLFTLLGGWIAAGRWPALAGPELPGHLAVLGACAVVAGCALCALGRAPPEAAPGLQLR